MARITDRLLIQRVGDRLIVVDEMSGAEIPVELDQGPRLVAMAAYLTDLEDPDKVLQEAHDQLVAVGAISKGAVQ